MTQNYISNYYPITIPSHRFYKLGWHQSFEDQRRRVRDIKPNLIFIGDSIVKGLSRYQKVWQLFRDYNAINLGIGGDKSQNVLWRCNEINFPPSVKFAFILCGCNNIDYDDPCDIADSIIQIGLSIIKQNKNCNVLISGIIPRDESKSSFRQYKI